MSVRAIYTPIQINLTRKVSPPAHLSNNFLELKFVEFDENATGLTWDGESLYYQCDEYRVKTDLCKQYRKVQHESPRYKQELLTRAIGMKAQKDVKKVVDHSFGIGEDAIFLYYFGNEVSAFERNPVVYLLGLDAANRFYLEYPEAKERFRLSFGGPSNSLVSQYDCAYYDPMYPQDRKKRLSKKEMQLFKEIVGEDSDQNDILVNLLSLKPKRLILKRPLKATPALAKSPSTSYKGKTVRFDVWIN